MRSFGIATINYGRPGVLRLWCASIRRLRAELDMFIPAVVVSGEEDKAICNEYKIWHVTQQNRPVTEKFNRSYAYMKSQGLDYVVLSGSDDIMSTQLVRNLMVEMEKGTDLIGVTSIYFYAGDGLMRGKLVRLDHRNILAPAKTVSAKVLDGCDWRPWNIEKNWGMDAIFAKSIAPHVKTKKAVGGMVVDVKTRVNLNSFNIWGRRLPVVDPQELYGWLSNEELTILNSL